MAKGDEWLNGLNLNPAERRVAETLLQYETDLSDGFGYYLQGDDKKFREIVRALVKAGASSTCPKCGYEVYEARGTFYCKGCAELPKNCRCSFSKGA